MTAVERARAAVGARFRLHGRHPEHGLDCVGLAAIATGRDAPSGYAMRGGDAARIASAFEAAGLRPVARGASGDIALVQAGPAQFHLIVLTPDGFVHADAGLRRVVERPGSPPWPMLGFWRT